METIERHSTVRTAVFLIMACALAACELNPEPVKLTPQQVFDDVSPSVFSVIVGKYGKDLRNGSAVAIAPDLVVTNKHVVTVGFDYSIYAGTESDLHPAYQRFYSAEDDLCILWVPGLNAKPTNIRGEEPLQVGERAFAVGNPLGLAHSFSEGVISGLRSFDGGSETKYIQTTAAISHGSSGGGLFDEYTNLVGITTASIETGQNLNFAVPSVQLEKALRENESAKWDLYLRGLLLYQAGDRRSSESKLRKAVDQDPEFAEGWLALSRVADDNLGDSDRFLEIAIDVRPDFSEAWAEVGFRNSSAFGLKADPELAFMGIPESPTVRRLWPEKRDVYLSRAIEAFERAVRIDANNLRLWDELCELYDEERKHARAEDACRNANKLDFSDFGGLNRTAKHFERMGNHSAAFDLCQRIVGKEAQSVEDLNAVSEAWMCIANYYAERQDGQNFEKSMKEFDYWANEYFAALQARNEDSLETRRRQAAAALAILDSQESLSSQASPK